MDFWFVFKKIAAVGLTPVGITIELVIVGMLMVRFSRRVSSEKPSRKWLWFKGISGDLGTYLIAGGCLFLYLCSIESVAFGLSELLERKHPPLETGGGNARLAPEYIVVLPGGHRYNSAKPPYSLLERKTFVRLSKGVDYWKQFPEAQMVFTGLPTEVEPMRDLAISMGVEADKIVEETESRDTKDHAKYLRSMLKGRSFLLVTSGNHMPRSVALFKGQGLSPTPAPTDLYSSPKSTFHLRKLVPKARNLLITDEAFHEHLGIGWAAVRSQLKERKEARQAAVRMNTSIEL